MKATDTPLLIGLTGLRGVGKSTVASFLAQRGFIVGHPFNGGKRATEAYFKYLGMPAGMAAGCVYGELKDEPNSFLPGGATPRLWMERFGKFIAREMGVEWTLGAEVQHLCSNFPGRDIVVESVVYEADLFRSLGGFLVRVIRPPGQSWQPPIGEQSDGAQAGIVADYTLVNGADFSSLHYAVDMMTDCLRQGLLVDGVSGAGVVLHREKPKSAEKGLDTPADSSWICTASGGKFWPMSPRPSDVDVRDVAHHLSMLCRYNGAVHTFYSVAEHSVLVHDYLRMQGCSYITQLHGLLHDASEAYLSDVTRPVKKKLLEYGAAERRVQEAIYSRYVPVAWQSSVESFRGRDMTVDQIVSWVDTAVINDERRQALTPTSDVWSTDGEHLGVTLKFWEPSRARKEFLDRFHRTRELIVESTEI